MSNNDVATEQISDTSGIVSPETSTEPCTHALNELAEDPLVNVTEETSGSMRGVDSVAQSVDLWLLRMSE